MFSMFRKMICLVSFVLVLSLVGDVQAAVFWWSDADPADHFWSTPGNWDLNALPTIDDLVRINIVPGPTVANEGAVASGILLYDNGALTVDGGTVNPGWFPVGLDSTGTLNMISGAITVSSNFWVGHNGGDGTVNMTGGTITCANFDIPQTEASTGHVNLHGGTINGGSADNFGMLASGSMDVRAGTLILNNIS